MSSLPGFAMPAEGSACRLIGRISSWSVEAATSSQERREESNDETSPLQDSRALGCNDGAGNSMRHHNANAFSFAVAGGLPGKYHWNRKGRLESPAHRCSSVAIQSRFSRRHLSRAPGG